MEISRTTVESPTSTATVLRLEGAAILVASLLAYRTLGGPWLWFAILFLAPDLMLGFGLEDPTAFKDTHLQRI